jgi:aryl-alcohol dehydrogenase-like predicted oxidoreductase
MQERPLGNGGPAISVVGYGAWQAGGGEWGEARSDAEVIAAMRAGIDAGMTWIDTAEVYGNGTSERLVGRAVDGRRDRVMVFSKVAPQPEGSGIRPDRVRPALEATLGRLGIDHLDLYQVHWPDAQVPVEETWAAMAELVTAGLTRRIGVSNFDRPLIERCLPIHPVASVQNELSLLRRTDTAELLPWLAEQGIAYLAYSPLASGLMTGRHSRDAVFGDDDWRRDEFTAAVLAEAAGIVDRLRPIARDAGTDVATLALRWVMEQPGVTAAIAGSLSAAHTRANAAAASLALDRATLAGVDAAVETAA